MIFRNAIAKSAQNLKILRICWIQKTKKSTTFASNQVRELRSLSQLLKLQLLARDCVFIADVLRLIKTNWLYILFGKAS